MQFLYSGILPLELQDGQSSILDAFQRQIDLSDRVEIAVGYVSEASLNELDSLVDHNKVREICLNIGMCFLEGSMRERVYHIAVRLNRKWTERGIGEIRLVKPFKYHGKVFCFYKDGKPISAIIGSANLGVIKPDAYNRRQYEFCALTTEELEVAEVASHIESLKQGICSANISDVKDLNLTREKNNALDEIEFVTSLPQPNVDFYKSCPSQVSFYLPLKVPKYEERFLDDNKHFTKSNINVCYAAPRSKRKPRDWYETQLTVSADIYRLEGYPPKNKPFFVITDDGYWFKAHTTSDNNKQFSAVGDELIMGRWLKGRLVVAGLVKPVNDTGKDKNRAGMITEEMLQEYGCNQLLFEKTGQTALDIDGTPLDVWMLSFVSKID